MAPSGAVIWTHIHRFIHVYVYIYPHTYINCYAETMIYIRMCTYADMHIQLNTHTFDVHLYAHIYRNVCVLVYRHSYIDLYIYTYTISYAYTLIHPYTYTYMCSYMYTRMHIFVHLYGYTYIHQYMPTLYTCTCIYMHMDTYTMYTHILCQHIPVCICYAEEHREPLVREMAPLRVCPGAPRVPPGGPRVPPGAPRARAVSRKHRFGRRGEIMSLRQTNRTDPLA